jgi:hypothetical protein
MKAQISASTSRRDDCPDGGRHPRLAKPLEIERTWGDAPQAAADSLDCFESAIAFAIREATRLQHEPWSGRVLEGRVEGSEP